MTRTPRTSAESEVEAVVITAGEMDAGTDAIIATDTTGTIVYWNARAEQLFGWRMVEALDRNIMDVLVPQQSAEQGEEIMRAVLQGHTWTGSFMVRTKNGGPMIVAVTDVPVFADGKIAGIVGVSKLG